MLTVEYPKVVVRGTPLYLGMTNIQAILIIEVEKERPIEDYMTAWQWLYDTGMYLELQGRYQRMVEHLLEIHMIDEKPIAEKEEVK